MTLLDDVATTHSNDLAITLDLTRPKASRAIRLVEPLRTVPERDSVVSLFGVAVDPLTIEESVDRAEALVEARRPLHHVCINAAKVVAMRKDARLRAAIAHADMVNVDGQSIVWASRVLRGRVPERVAGIDFMEALIERAVERQWPVYFLGARDNALQGCIDHFVERYPTLVVAGARNGYWTEEEQPEVLREIAESGARVVFVAMPTPRKEYLVSDHLEEFGDALVVGVGGSFDVFAGHITRAPKWVQRIGLEWFHRLSKEPARMWKRYLVGNTLFCLHVVRSMWQVHVSRSSAEV